MENITADFESKISANEKKAIRLAVRELSVLNPLRSSLSILFDWTIIISTIVLATKFANPFISILSIFIIGARQHALLLIMHDGAHNRLTNKRKINLYVSDFFCAFPLFLTTQKYCDSHLEHHKHLNTDLDPDWKLRKGLSEWEFPKSKQYIRLLLLRQLLGLNTIHIIGKLYRFGFNNKTVNKKSVTPIYEKLFRLSYYVILFALLIYFHILTLFLLYWLLPAFTVLPFLLRLRSLSEHFGLEWNHELNNARNVKANPLESFFLAPHSANYHLDHHLYPSVPFYNLKKLHKVLMRNQVYAIKSVNSNGYIRTNKSSVINDLSNTVPIA